MPIITNGLIGYWNVKQGVNGSGWTNIAPATMGKYDGVIFGAVNQSEGMYFDGVDDCVGFQALQSVDNPKRYEFEIYLKAPFNGDDAQQVILGRYDMTFTPSAKIKTLQLGTRKNGTSVINVGGTKTQSLPKDTVFKLNYVVDLTGAGLEIVYLNDTQIASYTPPVGNMADLSADWALGARADVTMGSPTVTNFFKGHVQSLKLYNRQLTPTERAQNSSIGSEVGLIESPPPGGIIDVGSITMTSTGEINSAPGVLVNSNASISSEASLSGAMTRVINSNPDTLEVQNDVSIIASKLSNVDVFLTSLSDITLDLTRVLSLESNFLTSTGSSVSSGKITSPYQTQGEASGILIGSETEVTVNPNVVKRPTVNLIASSLIELSNNDTNLIEIGELNLQAETSQSFEAKLIKKIQTNLVAESDLNLEAVRINGIKGIFTVSAGLDSEFIKVSGLESNIEISTNLDAIPGAIISLENSMTLETALELLLYENAITDTIHLRGERKLNLELSGKVQSIEKLKGRRELCVFLKGVVP